MVSRFNFGENVMQYCRADIAKMAGYTPGEQPRDRRYIKLNTNENPYPPSPRVAAALRAFDPERLRLYPDPVFDALRHEAVKLLPDITADWILFGNGSDDLLTIAVRTFVDAGGKLACLEPSYSLYPVLAGIQGAECVTIPLTPEFGMPADAAARAAGCSLFFIARPNAPTGNSFPLEDVRRLCREFKGVVWIDEAYADFAPDNCLELAKEFPNVVVSRTMSKSYSLAGLRLGWCYARPELTAEMMKVKDSYNAGMLQQIAGLAALEDRAYVEACASKICATRDRVAVDLAKLGCQVVPSAANFLFVRTPKPAEEAFTALRERGILVRYFPGGRTGDFLRITVGTDAEMQALTAAMTEILKPT
jgi:histidinol-phosphate aminotransferase